MTNLVWLRSDLRVYDNPALSQSMNAGDTIAVYCLADKQWDKHNLSLIKRRLIVDHLIALEEQLAHLNVPLKVIHCDFFADVPSRLLTLATELGIDSVFYNHEYEVNEQTCTEQTTQQLGARNIACHGFHDQCMITPGKILNGSGECYKVFTAFAKNWASNLSTLVRPLYRKPNPQMTLGITSDIHELKQHLLDIPASERWPIGEDEAHDRLNTFIEHNVSEYHNDRDFPDIDGTSQLSVYLALGVLSTRQCLQAMLASSESHSNLFYQQLNEGEKVWLNELVWRDFYRNILVAFPHVCKGKPFIRITDNIPWQSNPQLFNAWCEGKTGIPIVDAAMRQLNTTGWMHNRLRMIVAMFLTKHLMIDWRLGEDYFYSRLADADLASNNGGWQWSASTGVDAAPYFRIFNPYRQAERFDPNGDFVRKYVTELSHMSGKAIHQPSAEQALTSNYPLPIVDLKTAAEKTKLLFKNLKNPPAHKVN